MDNPIQTDYLRWIVLLPLLGAGINGLLGAMLQRQFGKRVISFVACTPVVISFLLSIWAFINLVALDPEKRFLIDSLYTWISLGSLNVNVAFWLDPLSVVMILVITGVGGLIHIYSIGYMQEDEAYWRYFAFLNLFTFAMLLLVTADNLLLMFIGWEGVGFCSYALIGFWYRDHVNTRAGNKAFIVNRVGDVGFLLGIFLIYWSLDKAGHGTVTFREIETFVPLIKDLEIWGIGVVTLATLFLFIGAMGKSAQIPLHVWLPDAMQGPTPVSALIHAATMVTAGVYMIARLNFLYSLAPSTLTVIATVGALTAFLSATVGLVQNDIKRVLAYSTVSQLGYMFLAMGAGAYSAGIFHLVTHAFFKACLFLSAGSVIQAMHHEQDMQKMGGLRWRLPYTHLTYLFAGIALAGIPPFAGFFSKDEILWKSFSHGLIFQWALGFAAAGLTAFYIFRQIFLVFYGSPRADPHTQSLVHESPQVMVLPLIILAFLSLIGGSLGVPEVLGGSNRIEHWFEPVFGSSGGHETASVAMEILLMALSVGIGLFGITLAYLIYLRKTLVADTFSSLAAGVPYRLLFQKYYIDELYQFTFVRGTLFFSRVGAWIDQYIIDFIVDGTAKTTTFISWFNGLFDNYVVDWIVNKVADLTFGAGDKFRKIQTGNINSYLYVVLGAVVLAIIVKLRYSG